MTLHLQFDNARIVKAINAGLGKAHENVQTAVTAIVLMQIENDGNMTAKAMREAVVGAADAAGFEAFRKLYAAGNAVYRDRGEVFGNKIAMQNDKSFEAVMSVLHGLIWKAKGDKNANDLRFTTVDSIRAWVKAAKPEKPEATPDEVATAAANAVHAAIGKAADVITDEQLVTLITRLQTMKTARADNAMRDAAATLAAAGLDIATPALAEAA